jgi:hypothetical protein
VAAAQRPVCGDECLERLLACHALKTPGAQDFVRSLGQNLAARRLPVIIGTGRSGVYTECEPSRWMGGSTQVKMGGGRLPPGGSRP